MIVQCDQCGQRARIREDKLPPQGGKIRCPQCQNVIIVRPPGSSATTKPPAPGAAAATPSTTRPPASRPARKPPVTRPDPAPEPAAEPAAAADAGEPDGDATPSTWKLRVSGLTYSFQTLDSLHQWLQGREKLDGIRVARDSDDWKSLGDYPEVLTDQLRLRFFPGGDVPTGDAATVDAAGKSSSDGESSGGSGRGGAGSRASTPDMRARQRRARQSSSNMLGGGSGAGPRGGARPRSRYPDTSTSSSSRAGTLGIVLLVMVAVAAGGHFAGLFDLGSVIPGLSKPQSEEILELNSASADTGPADTGAAAAAGANAGGGTDPLPPLADIGETPRDDTNDAEDARLDEELARAEREKRDRSLTRAQELIKERRYAEARAIVEPVARLWPEHLEVQETLLTIYERLDLRTEVRDQEALVATLREKARAAATDGDAPVPEDG